MENSEQTTKTALYGLTALTALLLTGGTYFWSKNRDLARRNDKIEQQSDSLLSARLQLEGDIRSLESQLETATDENTYLDKRLDTVNSLVSQRDQLVSQLRRTDRNKTNTIQQLNQTVAQLTTGRDSMENQMVAVRDKINWLTNANKQLTSQNTDLSRNVAALQTDIQTKIPRSALTGDAFRVETIKSNRKETAKAKKVAALMVSLSVPAELGITGNEEVYLSLTDQQRSSVMPPIRNATINLPDRNEVIPVHAVQTINFGLSPQRISFRIDPTDTLKPGLYRAAVFTKNAYLGTVEFNLRDSFWLF